MEISEFEGISELHAHEILSLDNLPKFNERIYYDKQLDYFSSGFDERVLGLYGVNKLDGLFQSEQYFFGKQDVIKSYIKINPIYKDRNFVPDNVCIINLRGGEYKRHSALILPERYWHLAIQNMRLMHGINDFWVVTDDERYARTLFPDFKIISGNVGDCYATLYNARYLIISNSSFSYFPIKTSTNSIFVIAPKYWARHSNSYNRWASVCNLYKGWHWQDQSGNLETYHDCIHERDSLENFYDKNFNIRTTSDAVKNFNVREIIPHTLRQKLKKILCHIFPRKYG